MEFFFHRTFFHMSPTDELGGVQWIFLQNLRFWRIDQNWYGKAETWKCRHCVEKSLPTKKAQNIQKRIIFFHLKNSYFGEKNDQKKIKRRVVTRWTLVLFPSMQMRRTLFFSAFSTIKKPRCDYFFCGNFFGKK